MTQSITGIDAYSNVWATAPDDFAAAQAGDIRQVAQVALNNTKALFEHSALDDTTAPGGNDDNYRFNGTVRAAAVGVPETGEAQILAQSGVLSLPSGSPKITLTASTGRAVVTDLQPTSQPAGNADPGANDLLTGPNVPKAWFSVRFNGDTTVTIHDRYNIASIVINGIATQADITFARAFAAGAFAISGSVGEPLNTTWKHGNKTTTTFTLVFTDGPTGTPINLNTDVVEFDCHVMGRQ